MATSFRHILCLLDESSNLSPRTIVGIKQNSGGKSPYFISGLECQIERKARRGNSGNYCVHFREVNAKGIPGK